MFILYANKTAVLIPDWSWHIDFFCLVIYLHYGDYFCAELFQLYQEKCTVLIHMMSLVIGYWTLNIYILSVIDELYLCNAPLTDSYWHSIPTPTPSTEKVASDAPLSI